MAFKFLDLDGLSRFYASIKEKLAGKLDKPTGTAGQVVGFTADNVVEAMDVPPPESVIEQNTLGYQKFWRGTKAEFDAVATKAADVMYIITDDEADGEGAREYIDSLVGDINSVLDAVNGEVPV